MRKSSSPRFTEKRKAMFMEPRSIYLYYSRQGCSLTFPTIGNGYEVAHKIRTTLPGSKLLGS